MKFKSVFICMIVAVGIILASCTKKVMYTIHFDSNGGSEIRSIIYDGASIINIPDQPTKENFVFSGWYFDDGTFEIPFSFNSLLDMQINNELIVYAKWIEQEYETYSITFDSNGGTTVDSLLDINKGSLIDPPISIKEGYNFKGWYIGADTNGPQFTNITPVTEDLVLYAKWEILTFDIHYELNGGINTNNPTSYSIESSTIHLNAPTKDECIFLGWYDKASFNGSAIVEIPSGTTGDFTLYAKWIINQYTMTFDSNGGSYVSAITEDYGTPILEPLIPTKEGYLFEGWYKDEVLTQAYQFTYMPNENVILFAKWTISIYDIHYKLNGGTNRSNPSTYTIKSTINLDSPSREGYTFNGWYNHDGFTGLAISHIPSGTTGNLTLYAKWTINLYTITFDSNQGSFVNAITQDYASKLTEPLEPVKQGYAFDGWYRDSQLKEPFEFTIMPAESITLYAKWKTVFYQIHYELDGGINSKLNLSSYVSMIGITTFFDPNKEGYTFIGWYNHEDFTGSEVSMVEVGTTGNLTLYAKWTINQYEVNYVSVGSDYRSAYDIPLFPDESTIGVYSKGTYSSLLTSNGRLFVWGSIGSNLLSNGTTMDSLIPMDVTYKFNLDKNDQIIDVSIGSNHAAVVTSNGRIFTWGSNSFGQLGSGVAQDTWAPVEEITSRFDLQHNEKIIQVSLSSRHSSAITSNGRIFMWGNNLFGQIGGFNISSSSIPLDRTPLLRLIEEEKIIQVSLGDTHSSVITSRGRIFMWGSNQYGQLGNGSTVLSFEPFDITSYFNLSIGETIQAVALGHDYSSAISSSGQLFLWGFNHDGQLGDGTLTDRLVPVNITSHFNLMINEKIIQVSLGSNHSCAITSEGRIFTWGRNTDGKLGISTPSYSHIPIEITEQFNLKITESVAEISLSFEHAIILTSDHRIFTWGNNLMGQLGDGTQVSRSTPNDLMQYMLEIEDVKIYAFKEVLMGDQLEKEGYTFDGWYTDSNLTIPLLEMTMPAHDVTLYARWIPLVSHMQPKSVMFEQMKMIA